MITELIQYSGNGNWRFTNNYFKSYFGQPIERSWSQHIACEFPSQMIRAIFAFHDCPVVTERKMILHYYSFWLQYRKSYTSKTALFQIGF